MYMRVRNIMSIFNVLSLAGGLALFLFGMNTMGDSLSKLSGGRMEKLLEKLTSKKLWLYFSVR